MVCGYSVPLALRVTQVMDGVGTDNLGGGGHFNPTPKSTAFGKDPSQCRVKRFVEFEPTD